jgi:hypothetical protein
LKANGLWLGLSWKSNSNCELLIRLPSWSKTIAGNLIVKRKESSGVEYIDFPFLFPIERPTQMAYPKTGTDSAPDLRSPVREIECWLENAVASG